MNDMDLKMFVISLLHIYILTLLIHFKISEKL